MSALSKLKRDLTKHRSKAVVLAILFLTMLVMGVRAVIELRPRPAVASGALPALPGLPILASNPEQIGDAQSRIQQSNLLWHALREVKATATESNAAFTFDAVYYPAPPQLVEASKPPVLIGPAVADIKPIPQPLMEDGAAKAVRIREQGRALVVKSTAVGNGTTEPMAIVNQQLVTIGQKILGFEVTAIRSREVEFVKEGVPYVGKMPDGQ